MARRKDARRLRGARHQRSDAGLRLQSRSPSPNVRWSLRQQIMTTGGTGHVSRERSRPRENPGRHSPITSRGGAPWHAIFIARVRNACPTPLTAAATATGLNRTTILRAIKSGKISGAKDEHGEWHIEPAELPGLPARCAPKHAPMRRHNTHRAKNVERRIRATLAEVRLGDLDSLAR
jgi:hypothetical protein